MTKPTPLVLVVGAGASREFGLPTGAGLKQEITKTLSFHMGRGRHLTSGDSAVYEALYRAAQNRNEAKGSIQDYLRAAQTIAHAMPLAPSIDNFIDSHRYDPCIAAVAKMAIVACILKAEAKSSLYFDVTKNDRRINFEESQDTWLGRLFGVLTQYCTWDELDDRLSQIAIVCFNYDRCIEHFLRHALATYYRLSASDAASALSKVEILHPYGLIGDFRPDYGGAGVSFGEDVVSDLIESSAGRLKTFTEGTDSSTSDISRIRAVVRGAKVLAYLGFAFHPLNLRLLYSDETAQQMSPDASIIGSALGISDSDRRLIASELATRSSLTGASITLHADKKAADLVLEYGRLLSRLIHGAA